MTLGNKRKEQVKDVSPQRSPIRNRINLFNNPTDKSDNASSALSKKSRRSRLVDPSKRIDKHRSTSMNASPRV